MATSGQVLHLPTTAVRPPDAAVAPYDFLRPTKLPRDQVRMLSVCLETFARRLTTLLTSGLRQVCQVELTAVEQMAYDDYVGDLPSTTLLAPVSMEPLQGTAILQFAVRTALTCVDHLLGGPGGEQPDRLPTEVETVLLRGLIDQMLGVLRYALEPVVPLQPTLATIEHNPQFVQAAGPSDSMMVARFRFVVGADSCELTLCLPLGSLGPRLASTLAHPFDDLADQRVRSAAALRLSATIAEAPLVVSVSFAPLTSDPASILALRVGDVLPLRHRVTAPLSVGIAGQSFAAAVAGRAGDQLAALVVNPSATPPEAHP